MSVAVGLLVAAGILLATGPSAAGPDMLAGPGRRRRWSPHGSSRVLARLRRRRRPYRPIEILALVEAVAPALEAGLAPGAALDLALTDAPATAGQARGPVGRWAQRAARAAADGDPVAPLLHEGAAAMRSPELALLAAAWSLSESTGAPLADAARTTTEMVRANLAQQRRLEAAIAGARSTMNVLTLLPLGGPLIALALGVDPGRLYAGSGMAQLSLGAGVLLAFGGRWWVRRLVLRAVRGPVVA